MAEDLSTTEPTEGQLRALMTELRALDTATVLARFQFANQHGLTFGTLRDEYLILGYPRDITNSDYRDEYERGGLAGKIVDLMPDACWRGDPPFSLIDDDDPEHETEFEKAWDALSLKHQIPSKFCRVDKLSRLSRYACLLLGDGAADMEQELTKGTGSKPLKYLRPIAGGGTSVARGGPRSRTDIDDGWECTIWEYESDPKSERFGLPKSYRIRSTFDAAALATPVHWTRICHIAEGLLDDEVFGKPALKVIWNLLIDLRKVTGGGAEAFWLRANQGMHIDVDKDMQLQDADNTMAKLKEQVEAYKHQLDRWIRTKGTKVTPLGSDVANFDNPADAVITQIAGATGIPKRILTGSEMGELASSQDRENFKDLINGRQMGHCGPNIVRQLADRLIAYGYLPQPKGGEYKVDWLHIQVLTEAERADGAQKWSATKVGEDPVFTDAEIRDKWYGMAPLTDEQRQEIDDRKAEAVKRQQEAMAANKPPEEEKDDLKAKDEEKLKDLELIRVLAAAIEAGNDEVVREIIGLGDVDGHPFYGNQHTEGEGGTKEDEHGRFKIGEKVKFDGKSVDGSFVGTMSVKVINPHSNRDKVTDTKKTRTRVREYEGASIHIPTATVENERGKRFEVFHHTLKRNA